MRGDRIIQTQLLMAQAFGALADHMATSTSYAMTPVAFAQLPLLPTAGTIACINNSTVVTWGTVVVGGGTNTVLAWYNGANWVVIGQ